jgi:hypothetical protein
MPADIATVPQHVHLPDTICGDKPAMPSDRPALPTETMRPAGDIEAPVVALFESEAAAQAASVRTGARMLRHASHGVMTLAPARALREDLYAAGALLVVG